MSNEVANTIFSQLGGRRFVVMTGAAATGLKNKLSVKLKRGSSRNKATHMVVSLNARDTYDVEFIKVHGTKTTEISKHEDIYADMLVELFERETGLYTSL